MRAHPCDISIPTQATKQQATTGASGVSSVVEIAGGMGLRSPQPQQLALDFAPAQVRSHGLRDAHTYPQVARRQGASFRVPASQAWGYPSLELRAGNSWPLMGFDCDVPEKVLDALVSNHWGARSDSCSPCPGLTDTHIGATTRISFHCRLPTCHSRSQSSGGSAFQSEILVYTPKGVRRAGRGYRSVRWRR